MYKEIKMFFKKKPQKEVVTEETLIEDNEPKLTPEQVEHEKQKLLSLCNTVFDTEYTELSKIIRHEYNYEFVFKKEGEELNTIKIISSEWFDKMLDLVNKMVLASPDEVEKVKEELEQFLDT